MGRAVEGKVRAYRVHAKLEWLGFTGSQRTTRRAVAVAKTAFRVGNRRVHRPWVTEPGMWLQYDYGDGPVVDGVKKVLFVVWAARSRFRVVLALRAKSASGQKIVALDTRRPAPLSSSVHSHLCQLLHRPGNRMTTFALGSIR